MSYNHTEGVLCLSKREGCKLEGWINCKSLEEGISSSFVREMLVESKAEATDDL